jgi:hypothetical protein
LGRADLTAEAALVTADDVRLRQALTIPGRGATFHFIMPAEAGASRWPAAGGRGEEGE